VDNPAAVTPHGSRARGRRFTPQVGRLRADPRPDGTVTYTELARWISPLTSARVVDGAWRRNPIALAIPCHRSSAQVAISAGYRWGIERKA